MAKVAFKSRSAPRAKPLAPDELDWPAAGDDSPFEAAFDAFIRAQYDEGPARRYLVDEDRVSACDDDGA